MYRFCLKQARIARTSVIRLSIALSIVVATQANAASLQIGAGYGYGTAGVRIVKENGTVGYTFKSSSSWGWLLIGAGGGKMSIHSWGLYGGSLTLKSDFRESPLFDGGRKGDEEVSVSGGGLAYNFTGFFSAKSPVGYYVQISAGAYSGSITQTGETPQVHTYASSPGGSLGLGFNFGAKPGAGSQLFVTMGAEAFYTALSGGKDENSKTLSDLLLGSGYGVLGIGLKI